jgi:hypothetical protein
VVGAFILLLGLIFLIAAALPLGQHFAHARERSVALQLASEKLDELLATVPATASSGRFGGAFRGYSYTATYDNNYANMDAGYAKFFERLTVTVTGPSKIAVSLEGFQHDEPFLGVAAPDAVTWISLCTGWNRARANFEVYRPGPPRQTRNHALPGGVQPVALACTPDGAHCWVSVPVDHTVYDVNALNPAFSAPAVLPSSGVPSGLTWDATRQLLWCADPANHCLWQYAALGAGTWTQVPLSSNPAPTLEWPSHVAISHDGANVWVADAQDLCLRRYDAVGGAWDNALYAPPGGMGMPRALAVASDGSVWTADATTLYNFNGAVWTTSSLPLGVSHTLCGLCVHGTPQSTALFVVGNDTRLWTATLATPASLTSPAPWTRLL